MKQPRVLQSVITKAVKEAAPKKRAVKVNTKLVARERLVRFVEVYRQTFSATKAAKAVGYKDSHAANAGHRLLKDPTVQELLTQGTAQAMTETKVTASAVLNILWELATVDPVELYGHQAVPGKKDTFCMQMRDIFEMPPHVRRCIASMKVKRDEDGDQVCEVKFWSKPAATALLAQHVGILRQLVEVEHRVRYETVEKLTDEQLLEEGETILERLRRDAVARATQMVPYTGEDDE